MSDINLDSTDRKLLDRLQTEFPLTREPYADLGGQLGISGEEVIQRIEQLKSQGLIRLISPILNARSLGYQSTLVAMRVAENRLDRVGSLIGEHPGISHGYERNHYFNFWFTLAIPPTANIETALQQLTSPMEAEAIFALPALKLFKIRVYFAMDGDGETVVDPATEGSGSLSGIAELSPIDRLVINELQQDLPLTPRPFTALSARLGLEVADLLAQCRSLKQRGIMRRFAAAINHRQAGFQGNAMTCWIAPPDLVDTIGRKLALLPEVSHCYERQTNRLWPYNLFAMIHGHTKEECQEIAHRLSEEIGLKDKVLLFSTKEFKKVRIKYLV